MKAKAKTAISSTKKCFVLETGKKAFHGISEENKL